MGTETILYVHNGVTTATPFNNAETQPSILLQKIKELEATEQILRVENKKLKDEAQLFSGKIANMRDRELESRVRSSVHEDMLEKLFEKLMDKI